jgi:hypothetical protein
MHSIGIKGAHSNDPISDFPLLLTLMQVMAHTICLLSLSAQPQCFCKHPSSHQRTIDDSSTALSYNILTFDQAPWLHPMSLHHAHSTFDHLTGSPFHKVEPVSHSSRCQERHKGSSLPPAFPISFYLPPPNCKYQQATTVCHHQHCHVQLQQRK